MITRQDNRIVVTDAIAFDDVRRYLAFLHDANERKGYPDIILDFSACRRVYASAILPIICRVMQLRPRGVDFELVLPADGKIARLFTNSNWAHLIDPNTFEVSNFRGYRHIPATLFDSSSLQHDLVDSAVDAMLRSLEGIERGDLAAIEWALNEITDNVLNHAASTFGGIVQLATYRDRKKIELVVVDGGLGIPDTLRSLYPKQPDYELLREATREGVTRSRERFQGNGLFGSAQMGASSGGHFRLHSGRGELKMDSSQALILRNHAIPFAGTLVDFCVSFSQPDLLQRALVFGGALYHPTDYVERQFEADTGEPIRFVVAEHAKSLGTRASGAEVRSKIANILHLIPGARVQVFVSGIRVLSSSFADEVFGKLYLELGAVAASERIEIVGANENVAGLIRRAVTQRTGLVSVPIFFR